MLTRVHFPRQHPQRRWITNVTPTSSAPPVVVAHILQFVSISQNRRHSRKFFLTLSLPPPLPRSRSLLRSAVPFSEPRLRKHRNSRHRQPVFRLLYSIP